MVNLRQTRKLGNTGLELTQLGLGTAALGWMYTPVDRSAAVDTIKYGYDQSLRYFDSSPLYGQGLGESRLGEAIAGMPRAELVISSKVGYAIYPESPLPSEFSTAPLPPPGYDYSYDGAFRLVEGSLKRLGISKLDMLMIHDPDNFMDEALAGTYRALSEMKAQGMVAAIGAGMNDSTLLAQFAHSAPFDCFLVAGRYTLLDQAALADLLPLAVEQGFSLLVGGAFNSGLLADPFAPNPTFNYRPAPPEWVSKARQIAEICQQHAVPIKAAALQFPLGNPSVTSVVTGARSIAELSENITAVDYKIPPELWQALIRARLLPEDVALPTTL